MVLALRDLKACWYHGRTHVLVNDPTQGYGILVENMLQAAQSAA